MPLEVVHLTALVDDGLLLRKGHVVVGELRDTAGVHRHILVGGELLLDALGNQDGGLAHHLVHGGHGTAVVQGDADAPPGKQGDQDCRHQADGDLFADTSHLSAPHNIIEGAPAPLW